MLEMRSAKVWWVAPYRVGKFYLEPEPPISRFSKAFFPPIMREIIARRKSFSEVSRLR